MSTPMPTPESSSGSADPTLLLGRTNTILYCAKWTDTVAFYRDAMGLVSTSENDWFVEFELAGSAHLSVADAARTTIAPGGGAGITLTWEVEGLVAARRRLVEKGIVVSEPTIRWGALAVFLHDPDGNRIELWNPAETTGG